MKVMYIGRDECGNIAIKAHDSDNGKFYGTKWGGAIRFIWYSKRDAEKEFRRTFGLQGKHFEHIEVGYMH